MRKRKKPYVLIMFLLICGCAVAFMNMPAADPSKPQPPEPPASGKEVSVPDKNSVASQVAASAKSTAKTPPAPKPPMPGEHGRPGGPPQANPDQPMVLREKPKPYKPTPNASSTANQWWTDQTTKTYDVPTVGGTTPAVGAPDTGGPASSTKPRGAPARAAVN